jgi:DNA-binding FrmR family transcriptional regulator
MSHIDTEPRSVIERLDRIAAQRHHVRRHLRTGTADLPELLRRLAATEHAIGRTRDAIRRRHLEACGPNAVREGGEAYKRWTEELVRIFDRFLG